MITDASRVQMEMLVRAGTTYVGTVEKEPRPSSRAAPAVRRFAQGACDKAEPLRHGRSHALVFELLRRPRGASVSEIATATDWRASAVRAFLSGSDLPLVIEELPDGERRYHIAALVEGSSLGGRRSLAGLE